MTDFLSSEVKLEKTKFLDLLERISNPYRCPDFISTHYRPKWKRLAKDIICARLFEKKTLEKIGLKLRLSRARIGQIEHRVLREIVKEVGMSPFMGYEITANNNYVIIRGRVSRVINRFDELFTYKEKVGI